MRNERTTGRSAFVLRAAYFSPNMAVPLPRPSEVRAGASTQLARRAGGPVCAVLVGEQQTHAKHKDANDRRRDVQKSSRSTV
jgi:hypothetical protein